MNITPEFEIGQFVYIRVCPDQFEQIVSGYLIEPGGLISYRIGSRFYYDFELSTQRNVLIGQIRN